MSAEVRAHGTRARYVFGARGQDRAQGCRCSQCRAAAAAYERDRYRAKHRPDSTWEPAYVDNAEAASHLVWLASVGVGLRTVSARTGFSRTTLAKIRSGQVTRSRRETVDAILAVGRSAALPGAYVPARDTWRRVDDLLRHGWTRAAIAREILGPHAQALQLGRRQVTAANAAAVAALHAEALRPVLVERENAADRRASYRERAALSGGSA